MALYYTPRHEDITGTSLSGVDGGSNRTYTLTNTGAVTGGLMVSVDGTWLQYGFHYTMTSDVITFLTPIYNSSAITIDYQTVGTTGVASGAYYTTPALVQVELRTSTVFSSSTTPTADTVNNWIDEESRVIDAASGQIFSNQVVSSTYIDYDGEGRLRFPHSPLVSITKVEYNIYSNGAAPSWITLEEGFDKNYISYLDLGEIEFISGVNATAKVSPLPGMKRFRLSYTYGYGTVPVEVQRLATLMTAKRTLMSLAGSQANTEGGSIQIGTIQITDPTSYGINYIRSMDDEIKNSLKNLSYKFRTYRPTRVY